jgi:hypothetical protein
MTMPHQCRCAICGEIGTIAHGLPNVFAQPPTIQPIEPDQSASAQSFREAVAQLDKPATCAHGYTVCTRCKFPPEFYAVGDKDK